MDKVESLSPSMRRGGGGGGTGENKGLSLDSAEIWHYLVKHGFLIGNASSHHTDG